MQNTFSTLGLLIFACTVPVSLRLAVATDAIRFDRDVQPILSANCFECHGPDDQHRKADLRLDIEAVAKERVIVPGHPDRSELITRITSRDPDLRMPPSDADEPLTRDEVAVLRRWIEEGAEWTKHWAFVTPERPALPEGGDPGWPRNAIDRADRKCRPAHHDTPGRFPVVSKNSSGPPIVVPKEAAKPLTAAYWSVEMIASAWGREKDHISLPLMIPLSVEMVDILSKSVAERLLTEKDQFIQTLPTNRQNPSFSESVQIRTLRWQRP